MAKKINGHEKLISGSFSHRTCVGCSDDSKAIKIELDEDLRTVTRLKRCKAVDDYIVSFSVGVQGLHPDLPDLTDIIRGCSSHANYHIHEWVFKYPKRKLPAKAIRPLNSVLEVSVSFHEATEKIAGQAFEWSERWNAGS